MPKIIILPFPNFTLAELQEAFGIGLNTAFLIRRLCWYEFAPGEFEQAAEVLKEAEQLGLSEPERILAVINILVGGMGINYLQDQERGLRFPYIRQADDAKPTLFYTGTFILRTLDNFVSTKWVSKDHPIDIGFTNVIR